MHVDISISPDELPGAGLENIAPTRANPTQDVVPAQAGSTDENISVSKTLPGECAVLSAYLYDGSLLLHEYRSSAEPEIRPKALYAGEITRMCELATLSRGNLEKFVIRRHILYVIFQENLGVILICSDAADFIKSRDAIIFEHARALLRSLPRGSDYESLKERFATICGKLFEELVAPTSHSPPRAAASAIRPISDEPLIIPYDIEFYSRTRADILLTPSVPDIQPRENRCSIL